MKKTQAIVFVNFHGLATSATRTLRTIARAGAGKYQVAKKTLIKKALESFDVSGEMPDLKGEVGVIFGPEESISAIAKGLVKFIKEHKELSVLGGIFEKKFIEPKLVSELAVIPSREVLLGRFVNIINSPIQRVVVTLNGTIRNFASVLSQIKK